VREIDRLLEERAIDPSTISAQVSRAIWVRGSGGRFGRRVGWAVLPLEPLPETRGRCVDAALAGSHHAER